MKASILVKKNKNFFIEDVHVGSIIEKFATPSYIYSKQRMFMLVQL